MKKIKYTSLVLGVFSFLVALAPMIDIGTMCGFVWGEPEYPSEKDYV